jgi:hypothetical protein
MEGARPLTAMTESPTRFATAIQLFDEANGEDPNRETHQGEQHPKELLYAHRMTERLSRFAPGASEAVRLAVRAQHIRRWEIPRASYPMDRDGYRKWRTELGRFHARTAATLLREAGYGEETILRVESLLRKERLKTNPDCQLLEDVICLVFLEHYLPAFVSTQDEAKLIGIIQKTWRKMSAQGQQAATELSLSEGAERAVGKALAG